MTWSIIARDPATGLIGIAVASRFLAVGSRVPFIDPQAGAVCSQALVSPLYGPQALALMRQGASAREALEKTIADDEGRESRQLHVMDREGRFAAFTGSGCVDWRGHVETPLCSVAGNMLAGPEVLDRTADAFARNVEMPLAQRLIKAMQAGEEAGGDKRGKQSAAILIYDEQPYSLIDLRSDDHPDPLAELERLEKVSRERWTVFRQFLPKKDDPAGVTDREVIEAAIAKNLAEGA
ncbi:MAG: DUF1028 domain-containing protein [Microvirga sp.]|nr:DUF1028 domain-containing protein [Microvirga sp.]